MFTEKIVPCWANSSPKREKVQFFFFFQRSIRLWSQKQDTAAAYWTPDACGWSALGVGWLWYPLFTLYKTIAEELSTCLFLRVRAEGFWRKFFSLFFAIIPCLLQRNVRAHITVSQLKFVSMKTKSGTPFANLIRSACEGFANRIVFSRSIPLQVN